MKMQDVIKDYPGKTTIFTEITGEEWDKLMESEREFYNFGNGFTYAKKTEIFH